jgi:cytochrome c oxidase cbb3-type subunit III
MSSTDLNAAKAHDADVDAVTGRTTTGHEWDGIRELNTPLPRWWLWTLYLTIVWAVGYMIVYPAWPLISSHTRGVLGYSSRAELAADMQALEAARSRQAAGLQSADLAQIKADPGLLRIALARGKAAFGDNCVGCHGQGGAGALSYPALVDDDWIWGGKLDDIALTIRHGVRWTQDERTRMGDMPAFVRTGMLKKAEAELAVEYVRSLARLDVLPGVDLAKAKEVFDTNCASCHGEQGKGNREVGSPDLTDAIWLYGSSRQAMNEGVANGRGGAMPAWAGRLDPVTIKALTIYVHSLGGGEP